MERSLGQLLYADVAVCLFGEAVSAEVRHLTLRQKAIVYCLVVEGCDWATTTALIGCTEWELRQTLKTAFANTKGGQ